MPEFKSPQPTSCELCIFAQYEENTQTGCKLDRLEKFRRNGTDLLLTAKDDKRFFIVDAFCKTCRNKEWGKKHPKRKWLDIVRTEYQLTCDVIIYFDVDNTVEDFAHTLNNVLDQTLLPVRIVVAVERGMEAFAGKLYSHLAQQDLPWRICTVTNENWDCIDVAIRECAGVYFCFVQSGGELPANLLANLNHTINEEIEHVFAVIPDQSGNGMIMQQGLYFSLGNTLLEDGIPILNRAMQKLSEQNLLHTVYERKQLQNAER